MCSRFGHYTACDWLDTLRDLEVNAQLPSPEHKDWRRPVHPRPAYRGTLATDKDITRLVDALDAFVHPKTTVTRRRESIRT